MKISFTDFSAPIGASVFKFCVHLQVGYEYCLNENKDAEAHYAFFSIFPSISFIGVFRQFSQQLLDLGF